MPTLRILITPFVSSSSSSYLETRYSCERDQTGNSLLYRTLTHINMLVYCAIQKCRV